jgi:uncharacterized protein (DUF58 family)
LRNAIEAFYHAQRRRSVLILISDFLDEGFDKPLRIVAQQHDVIPVVIEDPRERELPEAGWLVLQDAETGEVVEVDTSDPKVRAAFQAEHRRRRAERARLFKLAGVAPVEVSTNQPYVGALRRFFEQRSRARAA